MANEGDDIDYKLAQRELHDAMRELSALTGDSLPEFVEPKPPFCSFCGKGINEVRKMVAGPAVHICDECVSSVQKIMKES